MPSQTNYNQAKRGRTVNHWGGDATLQCWHYAVFVTGLHKCVSLHNPHPKVARPQWLVGYEGN